MKSEHPCEILAKLYSFYLFLVCDLQGVLDSSKKPFIFELTDPVIHNRSNKPEKKYKSGRTDRGFDGIKSFFQTHKCNPLCKLLGLPNDNDHH